MDRSKLYEPIASDLRLVEQTMLQVGQVEVTWLASLLQHVLGRTGKRMRPAMTLLAGSFSHYNLDTLVPMAASVELLHTATLVHDDTLDAASLRRGVPTVNRVWDDNIAVLFGDYLFAAAAEMVARTANVRVMRLFAETLRTICDGELSQQFNACQWQLSREQYLQRIGRKTASLFAMATESGAALSEASESLVQTLKHYGYKLGIAFQIADDLLDFSGEESALGKQVGSDLLQGTVTLPAIMLAERYPEDSSVRDFFEQGRQPQDLARIIEGIRGSSILADTYQVAASFCQQAVAALEPLPNTPARRSLVRLTEYALERRS